MKIQNIKYAIIFNIKCNNQVKRGEKDENGYASDGYSSLWERSCVIRKNAIPSMNPNEVRVKIKAKY